MWIPKVCLSTDQPITIRSVLVLPYRRRINRVEEFIPELYLKGVSNDEMGDKLKELFGDAARDVTPALVSKLNQC